MSFTVASYNIHKAIGTDGHYSPERILSVLMEIGADIVMLQEADRRFGPRTSVLPLAMIAARTGYRPVPIVTNPIGLGWHGNAALVSDRVTITAAVPLVLPSLEPRGAILAGESGERLGGLDEADEEFVVPCGDLAPQSD